MKEFHPTILIGYGEYGRRCLQAMLANAAVRGILPWEEPKGATLLVERRLESLALIHIPDASELRGPSESAFDGRDNFEMMEDLYQQIEIIDISCAAPAAELVVAVESAKERLFAEHRLTRSGRINLGLDVMVLARPTGESAVGKLSELLRPSMERLSEDPGFQAIEGQELLNFIEILDFEDFWDAEARQTALRAALFKEIERDREAAQHRCPAFGRVYLFDGRTDRGNHDETARCSEVLLFLEFLLFEGHRGNSEMRLFYMREPQSPALCTVGIRAVEFSPARLRRLAAASFSRGWLNYLSGASDEVEPSASSLIERALQAFLPPEFMEKTLGQGRLDVQVEIAQKDIEAALLTLPPAAEDWAAQVDRASQAAVTEWKIKLGRFAATIARDVIRQHLTPLPAQLELAVTESLSDDSFPRTAGRVLNELESFSTKISSAAETPLEPPPPCDEPVPVSAFEATHRDYLNFRRRQLDPAEFRKWWPMFAVAGAIAFLPMWRDLGLELLGEDWAEVGWQTTVYLASLFAVLLAIGVGLFHPVLQRAVSRPLEFFNHSQRGRFAALIRRRVASSAVRGALMAAARESVMAQRRRVAGEICGYIERIRRPLAEREREMRWLSSQLEGYLRLHGVDAKAEMPQFYPNREVPPVIRMLETDQDLIAVAAAHPRNGAQYRHVQRKLKILDGWSLRFSNAFLDPHRFLDRMAEVFPVAGSEERLAAELKAGLRHFEAFPASFYWLQSDGLPQSTAICSIPSHWSQLDGVRAALMNGGFHERLLVRSGGDRLFLVQGRFGIPQRLIGRSSLVQEAR